MSRQPSLFDFEAQETAERELAEWRKHFERADLVFEYDCGIGPKGTVVSGWRCPSCWDVEPNTFLLEINHGISPDRVGREDFLTECISYELQMHHATYDRLQREKGAAS